MKLQLLEENMKQHAFLSQLSVPSLFSTMGTPQPSVILGLYLGVSKLQRKVQRCSSGFVLSLMLFSLMSPSFKLRAHPSQGTHPQ